MSDIPQLDGLNSLPHPQTSNEQLNPSRINSTDNHIYQANFVLNRKKQLSKLGNDTLIGDYEITVSTNKTNVNIFCSSGFYNFVLPTLDNIENSEVFVCNNVRITCTEKSKKIDKTTARVNTALSFDFHDPSDTSAGGVRMHLHHTTRNIQVQGGAKSPAMSSSPVWFVDSFLRERFLSLTNLKSYDIARFNQTLHHTLSSQNKITKTNSTCHSCKTLFDGRSAPELCYRCKKLFHKKCLNSKDHHCLKPARTMSASSLPTPNIDLTSTTSGPNPLTSNITQQSAAVTAPQPISPATIPQAVPALLPQYITSGSLQASLTTDPPRASSGAISGLSPHSSPEQSQVQPEQPLIQYTPPVHSIPIHLNPEAPEYVTPSSSSGASVNVTKKQRKKKVLPPTDKAAFDMEFKKIELNAAKAEINKLESDVCNLEQTKFVLEERIKLLEEAKRNETIDMYFPKPGVSTNPNNLQHISPTVSPQLGPSHDCQQACICCTRHCMQKCSPMTQHDNISTQVDSLNLVLNNLSNNVNILHEKLKPSTPKVTSNEKTAKDDKTNNEDHLKNNATTIELDQSSCSTNTIDANVSEMEDNLDDLNSILPTIRLSQLEQSQESFLHLHGT